MGEFAIRTEGLGKRYRIGHAAERHDSLVTALLHVISAPVRNLRRLRRLSTFAEGADTDVIWALRDVSFDLRHGEVLGVVGRNGAGKSTLLKILSRITEPTTGYAAVNGRVGSLLEVGTGFHPELTGRENVFLNGSILGMDRAYIERKFDEIVEFSGVERFIDTPVKRYSSGMYLRLAFAVAAHLEPEVLVVDEVLAVGDAAFQKKCLGKMSDVAGEGRTVVFVSHNLAALQALCSRAIWLDGGEMKADADPAEVVDSYLSSVDEAAGARPVMKSDDGALVIEGVDTLDERGQPQSRFAPGDTLVVDIRYATSRPVEAPYLWLAIRGRSGTLFGLNMLLDGARPARLDGQGRVRCVLPDLPLLPQQNYTVVLGGRHADGRTRLFKDEEVAQFRVIGTAADLGLLAEPAETVVSTSAPVLVEYRWELPDGRTVRVEPRRAGRNGVVVGGS